MSRRRPGRPWLSYPILLVTAVAAIALTFFGLFRIGLGPGALISFRHDQTWRSTETLLVTRAVSLGDTASMQRSKWKTLGDDAAGQLAHLYAQLVTSDAFRDLTLRSGPLHGRYEARALGGAVGASSRERLPLLSIDGLASSPARAAQIAARVSSSSRAFIEREQDAANVPRSARVRLQVISAAGKATLVHERRLTGPLAALGAVLALLVLAGLSRYRAERR